MKCAERTGLGPNRTGLRPNQTGLYSIKSVPLRWTSIGSSPDLDRTGVGFTSTRLTVFDVHHRSRGLSSLSKFVVILRVRRNSRSPSSLLKSVVILQVQIHRSSSSRLLLLKPIILHAAEVRSCYWSTEPGCIQCMMSPQLPRASGLRVRIGSGLACQSPLRSVPFQHTRTWTGLQVQYVHFILACTVQYIYI